MKAKALSKNKYLRKKPLAHPEGKFWCDCITKNYRKWLGIKYYGFND